MTDKKYYDLSVPKDKDFSEGDILIWLKTEAKGRWTKRDYKKKVSFRFHDIDDAFKFKFRWTKT